MKHVNVAELKNHMSEYLDAAGRGEDVVICKRNIPFARISLISSPKPVRTVLGAFSHTATIVGDLTEPLIASGDWDMLTPCERADESPT